MKLLAAMLGLFSLVALLFVRSEANTLQLPEENATAFVKQVIEQLKKLNGDVAPTEVSLEAYMQGKEKNPAAFLYKDIQAALNNAGIKVRLKKTDYTVKVGLVSTTVQVASKGWDKILPTYNLEGFVSDRKGNLQKISFKVDLTDKQKQDLRELADPIYEERALIDGIHVDIASVGGIVQDGMSTKKILEERAEPPTTHIEGSKVFSARGGSYAVEIFPVQVGPDGIQQASSPYQPIYKSGYAYIPVKSGDTIALRIHNLDKAYDASTRIMLDTLDSFEFSNLASRKGGGARWWIGKNSYEDIQGWDYKPGKALTFLLGTPETINVGSAAENQRLQEIVNTKSPKQGGQICISFKKTWPQGSTTPVDESWIFRADRFVPGKEFDRKLEVVPNLVRGLFRANIVIRYGEW